MYDWVGSRKNFHMENRDFKSDVPERENGAAFFVMAAILFIIVLAAVNVHPIVHELGIAIALF